MSQTNLDPDTATMDDAEWQHLWKRRCGLLNWAGITYRYHRKRQRFFDWMDKLTQVAAVMGGVAVLGKTIGDNLPWVGGAIAATGLLALVYGYSDRRQCHKELAEQAIQFAGDIESLPYSLIDEAKVCDWDKQRAAIDLREPPNLTTLVSKCEWEQAVADGHPNHTKAPAWWQQLHMHFF